MKVTSLDEINGSEEVSAEQSARVGLTTNEQEVASGVNQTVVAERELQLNALAKDQAMSDADAGNYRNAAESLRANAQKLEAVAANTPLWSGRGNLDSYKFSWRLLQSLPGEMKSCRSRPGVPI